MRNNPAFYRLFLRAELVEAHAAIFACRPAVRLAEAVADRGRAVTGSAMGMTP
jgi:hypothetical protein